MTVRVTVVSVIVVVTVMVWVAANVRELVRSPQCDGLLLEDEVRRENGFRMWFDGGEFV